LRNFTLHTFKQQSTAYWDRKHLLYLISQSADLLVAELIISNDLNCQ